MSRQTRLLLLGLGDVGRRLALGIAARFEDVELVVAGRNPADGARFAALADACATSGRVAVRFVALDGVDAEALAGALRRERPDAIVQCAALLSPWALGRRGDPAARAVAAAGFALQLPAQLPIVHAVMTAARAVGFTGPVINASYPDVTHPVLAALALAPTLGIGNAGMIEATVRATLRARGEGDARVRVIAHHSHVTEAMTRDPAQRHAPVRPRVFVGDAARDELVAHGAPLAASIELNALTCAHGLAVLRALAPGGAPLATSVPGPLGLPGGWPVRIAAGEVALDLPPGVAHADAVAFQHAAATGDGVARIADDGTVHFTDAARRAVAPLSAELAAPLAPGTWLERLALLRRLAGIA